MSPATLLLAGKLAQLNPNKTLLELGSGKGYPSLLWASVFGVNVHGVDFNRAFVDYAVSRAKLLNLSGKVEYVCQDLKDFKTAKHYDVTAALGLDLNGIYGGRTQALRYLKSTLTNEGTLILAEPVWTVKPVPSEVLNGLGVKKADFVTVPQMEQLIPKAGFEEVGHFVSSKEDWEMYVRPLFISLREIIAEKPELAKEAQRFIAGFEAEHDLAEKFWNMALWVLKQK